MFAARGRQDTALGSQRSIVHSGLVFPGYISIIPQESPDSRSYVAACDSQSRIPLQRVPGSAMENQGLVKEKRKNDSFPALLHWCR